MGVLKLHGGNRHYLELDGSPVLLVTSGACYGPVINLDFDWQTYVDTLAGYGFNHTRVFTGTYIETRDDTFFHVKENNLAPAPGRFIAPWARSSTPGFCEGGLKFDLSRWDPRYFARFKEFLAATRARSVVVEVVLFCTFYCDSMWRASPLHPGSNINGTPDVPKERVFDMDCPPLLALQEHLVAKIVRELNEFDNLYYELINEPYAMGGEYDAWQDHMTDLIVRAESRMPKQHLIARNFRNYTQILERVHPNVSIANFHYAEPCAVMENYGLGRVIADDETGFKGQGRFAYRREAWKFLLAGGGVFSHLDYSFTVDHPDGSMEVDANTPGMGSPMWREELAAMKRFLERLPFSRMRPANELWAFHFGHRGQVFAEHGRQYVVYLDEPIDGGTYRLVLPGGTFAYEWLDPATTRRIAAGSLVHGRGEAELPLPGYAEDILLHIRRSDSP
jgi:hypothetical protein